MKIKSLIIFCIVTTITGCGGGLQKIDLVGKYRIEYAYGVETLDLLQNGKYIQAVSIKNNPVLRTREGNWIYNSTNGNVNLENPMLVDNNFGSVADYFWEQKENGYWVLSVNKSLFGTLSLRWNDDMGYALVKIN